MNRIEAVGKYLGSVVNRVTGRAAWMEDSTREVARFIYAYPKANSALEKFLDFALEQSIRSGYLGEQFLLPVSYRLAASTVDETSESPQNRCRHYAKFAATIPVDLALWAPVILSIHNPVETAVIKLATNAVVQMGLDAASAVANRTRSHRPSDTTFTV